MSWGNGLCSGRGMWRQGVRFGRGGQPLHRNPHLYGAPSHGRGKSHPSPIHLRPKGGRSPSHGNHYSQLQWRPAVRALTCNPKVTCPFPGHPQRQHLITKWKGFAQAAPLFLSQRPAHSTTVPQNWCVGLIWLRTDPPLLATFLLLWGQLEFLTSKLATQSRRALFLKAEKAWKPMFFLFSHVGMVLPSLTPFDLLYRMLYDVIIILWILKKFITLVAKNPF